MPPHGGLGSFGIMALDGSQDPAVPGKRLLRTPFHLQRSFPRIAQQVHESVEHFQNDTVPRSHSNAVMEFRVLGDRGLSLLLLFPPAVAESLPSRKFLLRKRA